MSIIRRRSAECKIRFVYYSINIFYISYPSGDLPVDPVSEAEQIIVGLRFFRGRVPVHQYTSPLISIYGILWLYDRG